MRALIVIVVLWSLTACAGHRDAQSTIPIVKPPSKIPSGLILDRQITGNILGYDLNRPSGLALNSLGDLYIADAGNNRVVKLDRHFQPVRDLGGFGEGYGRFQDPGDMVMDRDLSLYVLDRGNRRVVQLDANLGFVEVITPEDAANELISNLGRLAGVAVLSFGEIVVADNDNSRLIRLDNMRKFSRYIGDFGYGSGALLNPEGIALDRDGRIYVADGGNGRIAVYDNYGNYTGGIGKDVLERPTAVTVAFDGVIWVGDQATQALYAFAPDGKLLQQISQAGEDGQSFSDIEALSLSPDGVLYVADSGHNRVLVYHIVYEESR
ncbi:MAG: NHL repeat-containing protein [candidate division Zixibacteria bacterium]|nr:NHL repeat-containing protein [candidate division Zixibacteria bacterium]